MDFDFSNITNDVSNFFNSISSFLDDSYKRLAAIVAIMTICGAIFRSVLKRIKAQKELRLWRDNEISKLGEIIDESTLNLIKSNNFIPTMGQLEAPHDGESIHISSERISLLEKFLDVFDSESIDKKRYILMGGSGMGKSTFASALFYRYIYYKKNKRPKYPIYIKSLGRAGVLDDLQNMANLDVQKSIIILDALDENYEASKDLQGFLEKLEETIHGFKYVLITCRTQFFQSKDDEPQKWSIPISGGAKRKIEYERIYISPFTDEETNIYLKEKYKNNQNKYVKAIRITERFNDMLTRPMILSFMDDLLSLKDLEKRELVELYADIIDKWFDRENDIQKINKKELYSFSKGIALFLYEKWQKSENAFLTTDEYNTFLTEYGYEKSPYSFKERSLINRRDDGSIKFSHRSFWEFFLAVNIFEHPGLMFKTSRGVSMAKEFAIQIYKLYLKRDYLNCIYYANSGIRFNVFDGIKNTDIFKRVSSYLEKMDESYDKSRNKDESSFHEIQFKKHMYELWEMMLWVMIPMKQSFLEAEARGYLKKNHNLIMCCRRLETEIDRILSFMLDFFKDKDISRYDTIKEELKGIILSYHKIKDNDFKKLKSHCLKEVLYYPDLFPKIDNLNEEERYFFHTECIWIMGWSFCSLERMRSIIKTKKAIIQIVCICIEENDLDSIVRLMEDLCKIKSDLVFKITYKKTPIYYTLCRHTFDKYETKLLLKSMYECNSLSLN